MAAIPVSPRIPMPCHHQPQQRDNRQYGALSRGRPRSSVRTNIPDPTGESVAVRVALSCRRGVLVSVRLLVQVDLAVVDIEALRRSVLERLESDIRRLDLQADFAEHKASLINGADERDLAVMAFATEALLRSIEELPGVHVYGTRASATEPWPAAEDL